MSARTPISSRSPRITGGRGARRWFAPTACRRQHSDVFCPSLCMPARGFVTTAILTGLDCGSATTSCASTVRGRGALALPIISPPSKWLQALGSHWQGTRSRRCGMRRWRRPCRNIAYPLQKKRWPFHCCKISTIDKIPRAAECGALTACGDHASGYVACHTNGHKGWKSQRFRRLVSVTMEPEHQRPWRDLASQDAGSSPSPRRGCAP